MEHAITSIVWDAAISSAEYFERANAAAQLEGIGGNLGNRPLLEEIGDSFLEENESLTALLDPKNWKVRRPSVRIQRRINQAKNLSCRWSPVEGRLDDFQDNFSRQILIDNIDGWDRPLSEFIWIRNFGRIYRYYFSDNLSVRALLIFAVRARYEEMISRIREVLDVEDGGGSQFDWSTGVVA